MPRRISITQAGVLVGASDYDRVDLAFLFCRPDRLFRLLVLLAGLLLAALLGALVVMPVFLVRYSSP